MAKQNTQEATTWGGKMKEFGGGNFTFLSTDGETITFIVVGLPVLLKGTYKNKEQERIGIPLVSEDGFQLLIGGKRLARKLAKHEKEFTTNAIMVRRDGAEGDVNAKYPITILPEKEAFEQLCKVRDEDFTPDMIADAVKDALEVLKQ